MELKKPKLPAIRNKVKALDLPVAWNDKYIIVKKNARGESAFKTFPVLFDVIAMMIGALSKVNIGVFTTKEVWNRELDDLSNKLLKLKVVDSLEIKNGEKNGNNTTDSAD